jgi:GR25 family glycosyltransferase involved in LPS biosynthesis
MKNFIICLSKIEASLKTATDLKNQLEAYGQSVELFEGTYGNDAVKQTVAEGRTLHPWGIKGPPPPGIEISSSMNQLSVQYSPGIQGCFYSHYRLWQKCVELNEPIVIWEDDIVLYRNYQPVEWDDILVLALGHPGKTEKYRHYLDTPEGDPVAADYYQSSMPGNCGYAIKPHAAKKLVETYSKTYLPADNAINQHHVKIQIHSYVMGIALTKKDGKQSLTNAKKHYWDGFDEQIQ